MKKAIIRKQSKTDSKGPKRKAVKASKKKNNSTNLQPYK